MYNLKNSETLLIDRRRRGENQTQAAKRWRVSQTLYSLWERNKHTDIPRVGNLEPLKNYEKALLKRKRENLTQAQLAKRLGCSDEWLKRMEKDKANGKLLFEYWGI
jgi:transcriptional regulator with XRE-family HTH domain